MISPYPDSGLTAMREPPHGLAYIASTLRQHGYCIEVINAKENCLKTKQVVTQALSRNPDLVGLTAVTPDIIWAAKIADGIKQATPDTPIVVGGPHATALPQRTIEEFPGFDVAVIAEGEYSLLELAENAEKDRFFRSLERVCGIGYRNGADVAITPPRQFIENLDDLPFPAWDLFPIPQSKSYPIYATRGCPFQCKFCQRVLGNKIRARSVENVVEEIEWILNKFGATGFWFADETFGFNRRWTARLLDLMTEKKLPDKLRWHAQTRIDIMKEDLLTRMKKAGCDGLAFGVESGNPEILAQTGKKIKLDDVERVVALASKIGLKTRSFFILGHPNETIETIQDTIDFAAKINTDFVSFAVMVPYPGTEVWNLAKQKKAGYSHVSENWDDYRKHLTTPLGFTSIPPERLRNLDIQAYLTFYIRNDRWLDLTRLLWEHRLSARAYLFKRLKRIVRRILFLPPKDRTLQ